MRVRGGMMSCSIMGYDVREYLLASRLTSHLFSVSFISTSLWPNHILKYFKPKNQPLVAVFMLLPGDR
jgi:hypothetical protein